MASRGNRSEQYARRRAKCLQLNLCFQCQQDKGLNHFKCNGCLNKNNIKDRERRRDRAAQNLCDCGQPSLQNGRLCSKCREIARLFQEQKRKSNRLTGTCLTCGKNPPSGHVTCVECNERATTATLARYRNNILLENCAFCGGVLDISTFRCNSCHTEHIDRGKMYWHQRRLTVVNHYGGKCQCCGVTQHEFLDVDHINCDGTRHRNSINCHFYEWIIRNNFPTNLQLLCANCNRGRSKFGICPHHQEPDQINKNQKRVQRQRVITKYGGVCKCCGEKNWAFLEFDHIHNDGAIHRKSLGNSKIITWIIANNYPDTIQLLCSNCNKAKGLYGNCPHNNGSTYGTDSKETGKIETSS